jgi:hypothetical protein
MVNMGNVLGIETGCLLHVQKEMCLMALSG